MDMKQLLEFAGVDTSKGKAKALLESLNQGFPQSLTGLLLVEDDEAPEGVYRFPGVTMKLSATASTEHFGDPDGEHGYLALSANMIKGPPEAAQFVKPNHEADLTYFADGEMSLDDGLGNKWHLDVTALSAVKS